MDGLGDIINIQPYIGKALGGIALGFAYYYSEILHSWQNCGSDNLCKAEKLVQYITIVLGVSRPAAMISGIIQRWLEKVFGEMGGWTGTLIYITVYSAMEYLLSFVLDWVRYATECLKVDDCEKDDILIWISNMKLKHCGETVSNDEDYDDQLLCDSHGGNCVEIGDDNDRPVDWCITFFNELPILMLVFGIWVLYVLSIDENERGAAKAMEPPILPIPIEKSKKDDPVKRTKESTKKKPTESGEKKDDNDNTKGKKDDASIGKKDEKKKDRNSKKDETDQEKKDEGLPGLDDTKDEKTDESQTDDADKEKDKKRNKESRKSTSSKRDSDSSGGPSSSEPESDSDSNSDTQELEIYCPCCESKYVEAFPDPLSIYCDDCGKREGSKTVCSSCDSKNVRKTSKKGKKSKRKSSRKAPPPSKHNKKISNDKDKDFEKCKNPVQDKVKVNMEDNYPGIMDDGIPFLQHGEEIIMDNPQKTPSESQLSQCHVEIMEHLQTLNLEEDSDEDEENMLYIKCTQYAVENRKKLIAMIQEPAYCKECLSRHVDHIHVFESDDESEDSDGNTDSSE